MHRINKVVKTPGPGNIEFPYRFSLSPKSVTVVPIGCKAASEKLLYGHIAMCLFFVRISLQESAFFLYEIIWLNIAIT